MDEFVPLPLDRANSDRHSRANGNPGSNQEPWIPRIKYGAGLLEFIPVKTGTGMTRRVILNRGNTVRRVKKETH